MTIAYYLANNKTSTQQYQRIRIFANHNQINPHYSPIFVFSHYKPSKHKEKSSKLFKNKYTQNWVILKLSSRICFPNNYRDETLEIYVYIFGFRCFQPRESRGSELHKANSMNNAG